MSVGLSETDGCSETWDPNIIISTLPYFQNFTFWYTGEILGHGSLHQNLARVTSDDGNILLVKVDSASLAYHLNSRR